MVKMQYTQYRIQFQKESRKIEAKRTSSHGFIRTNSSPGCQSTASSTTSSSAPTLCVPLRCTKFLWGKPCRSSRPMRLWTLVDPSPPWLDLHRAVGARGRRPHGAQRHTLVAAHRAHLTALRLVGSLHCASRLWQKQERDRERLSRTPYTKQ